MNDREAKRRAVTASVVAVCGLVLGASLLVVASVDRIRRAAQPPLRSQGPTAAPLAARGRTSLEAELTRTMQEPLLAAGAPAQGLRRAPAPGRRRVVVVRRTRAS